MQITVHLFEHVYVTHGFSNFSIPHLDLMQYQKTNGKTLKILKPLKCQINSLMAMLQ